MRKVADSYKLLDVILIRKFQSNVDTVFPIL